MIEVGYDSRVINSEKGVAIEGYYVPRFVKGQLDDLLVCALAIKDDKKTVIFLSYDNCMCKKPANDKIKEIVSKELNIPLEHVFVSVTHSHTAPSFIAPGGFDADIKPIEKYFDFVCKQTLEAVKGAVNDLKKAKFGYGTVTAPDRIAYIRRYKMKDGSTWTCPPINDKNIVGPLGQLDQRVNVIRIDREKGESIVLLNYGLHVDCTNGEMASSDWVGWVRDTIGKSLDGTKVMCIMGAQGDVGSTHVFPTDSDMNDTEISFDNEMKSPGMARFVGRALSGSILQIFDKVQYVDCKDIGVETKKIKVKLNVPDKKDLPLAHKYKELHDANKDCDIPYTGMELTTVVAEALRMCDMENSPKTREIELVGLRIGNIAFVGIPGEPFTEIGVEIKKFKGFDIVLPCALTNGYEGYFPSASAYKEGGYEARTSPFAPTITKDIVNCSNAILKNLKKGK